MGLQWRKQGNIWGCLRLSDVESVLWEGVGGDEVPKFDGGDGNPWGITPAILRMITRSSTLL